jgi:hypothetical protein
LFQTGRQYGCWRMPVEPQLSWKRSHTWNWQRETIPKIWFSLDHIKGKVERDLGSSKDMEWHDKIGWRPVTDIHETAFPYRRYQHFQSAIVLRFACHPNMTSSIPVQRLSRFTVARALSNWRRSRTWINVKRMPFHQCRST